MRVIIDAMGGDNAPEEIVKGAVRASRELDVEVVLVGQMEKVQKCLADEGATDITVIDARDVITMEDDPSTATRRKKDASMTVALNMLRDGEGDAVVSAGSTGALLTGATLIVKRIRGIRRAAMAPALPVGEKGTLLIDCGANAECTPEYLLQFTYMGSFYAKKILHIDNPRVGLLNVGTEDTKGDALRHETFALLKEAGDAGRINFVGNVEASGVYQDLVDVVVTDGFTGNILLKTTEGVAKMMSGMIKKSLMKSLKTKIGALLVKDGLKEMKKAMDADEIGGTAFLGISKPVIKAHGSSKANAIFAAIRQAKVFSESGFTDEIKENIDLLKIDSAEG